MAHETSISPTRSGVAAHLHRNYMRILPDCILVTATDRMHAPYLFNAIASIQARFPNHPPLRVFDLGMSNAQRRELSSIPWIEVRTIDKFVKHWKQNWSWKPYILSQTKERYVFYFDAANIMLYRPLTLWFTAIARNGYFLIENGQTMHQTTPPEYWGLFGLDEKVFANAPTFGAGLMGFDQGGFAGTAIAEVLARTVEGWNLGRSAQEIRRTYDHSVIRHCECFRADQTLFNLAFRKHCPGRLVLRNELKYCGLGGPADHPRQYLWYSRRRRDSLTYFWRPIGPPTLLFVFNRVVAYITISVRRLASLMLRHLLRRRP
jgi:hypothetical protein